MVKLDLWVDERNKIVPIVQSVLKELPNFRLISLDFYTNACDYARIENPENDYEAIHVYMNRHDESIGVIVFKYGTHVRVPSIDIAVKIIRGEIEIENFQK